MNEGSSLLRGKTASRCDRDILGRRCCGFIQCRGHAGSYEQHLIARCGRQTLTLLRRDQADNYLCDGTSPIGTAQRGVY